MIGTTSMSEFFVTVAAVLGLFLAEHLKQGEDGAGASSGAHNTSEMRLDLMGALLIGGLLAAPIAPLLVTSMEPRLLGVVVAGFICLTNARTLCKACGASADVSASILMAITVVWVGSSASVARRA